MNSDLDSKEERQLSSEKIFERAERLAKSAAEDGRLSHWLLHLDTWTPLQAMLLILGIDPASAQTKEELRYGKHLVWIDAFSRFGADDSALDSDRPPHELMEISEKLTDMMRAWESGSHPSRFAPVDFIRWAIEKGFPPRWYEWACELNLLDKESIESRSNTVTSAYVQPKEEPKMRCGSNSLAACNAWCAYMATQWKGEASTREELAEKIKAEAERRKYRTARGGIFTTDMIVHAMPQGTTGTRKDNRRGGKRKLPQ